MTELWRLSAAQLTAGYARGAFTPVDALAACLARVDQCQPLLNAIVARDDSVAACAALASRARWHAGKPLGPLDGVPISVKDNLHMAGVRTSWGSRLLARYVPDHDEAPVTRLRAGGALLFGKTNLPEFAMEGITSNLVHGGTRNPWNLALTPGGSSGGAAAAVAGGCGPLALATDGGGSIRRPASHCGLVGFKPSAGLVPRHGGLPEIFLGYEVVGGIGRCVDDVANLTRVISGAALEPLELKRLRILFIPTFGSHPVDADIAASVQRAARLFEASGHRLTEADSFDLAEPINACWAQLSNAGLAWMLTNAKHSSALGLANGETPDLALCGETARANFAAGSASQAAELFEVLARAATLQQGVAALFTEYDVILTPATAALPWPHGQSHPGEIAGVAAGPRGHAVFTAFANAAGLPAIALPSAPIARSNGSLPTGFQLIAPAGADALLFSLASHYEAAVPAAAHGSTHWPEMAPT